ncbi:hypothetical protein VE03_00233 [Pseudogymnoascus sp. 23342-1-I1]|nr:hypothetical protein VE03_00233 [Pseudogymnoascus sp. 23342-1-I1]
MKSQSLATLVAVAASLQGVVATGWNNAPIFTCPGKTPIDKCEPQQIPGFNWGDLNLGSFDVYAGFDFSGGWSCKSSFAGRKRDALLPRTFGSKCITGTTHADVTSCPKIKASTVDKFSITHLQVSVEFDCDLEFHYTLPDKSICKQKSSCKSTGTTVENTQCGGATDVTVVYPKPPKGGKSSCSIGIHSIGFDCPTSTATASTVASTTTAAPTVETTPTVPETTPVPTTTDAVPTDVTTDVTTDAPSTTAEVETPTATETEVTLTTIVTDVTVTSCPVTLTHVTSGLTSIETTLTTSTVVLTSTKTFCPKCTGKPSGPVETGGVPTTTETTPEPTTTDVTPEPTTTEGAEPTTTETTPEPTTTEGTAPTTTEGAEPTTTEGAEPTTTEGAEPTTTDTVPGTTETATEPTETETTPEQSTTEGAAPTTTEGTQPTDVASTTEAGPAPTDTTVAPPQTTGTTPGGDSGLPCPAVLPQCIKTWLPTECKSNSDIACFCPKADFTKDLFACLTAFGATDDEINDAAEFFQGICAPYVPTNPGIVTDCPTKGVSTSTQKPHTVPVTTIVVETTVTVPCAPTGTATESSFTVTTISTQVTVPQVVLTSTNSDVIVVTGPATVEATQTAAVPVYTTPVAGNTPVYTTPAAGNAPGFTTSRTIAGTGTGGLPQPTQPAFVPGSASKSAVSAGVLGAVMALVALVV